MILDSRKNTMFSQKY